MGTSFYPGTVSAYNDIAFEPHAACIFDESAATKRFLHGIAVSFDGNNANDQDATRSASVLWEYALCGSALESNITDLFIRLGIRWACQATKGNKASSHEAFGVAGLWIRSTQWRASTDHTVVGGTRLLHLASAESCHPPSRQWRYTSFWSSHAGHFSIALPCQRIRRHPAAAADSTVEC